MINLEEYFERIGFDGEACVDLDTLKRIHLLHPAAMAFENVDVLLDRGIGLNPDQVQQKLLRDRRGGYCFEHNNLLMWVLREIGFEVEPLMARAVWRQPEGTPLGPRTHMVLRVTIDGQSWLADVGFGGIVLNAPIQWIVDEVQQTPLESFRLVEQPCGYRLEVQLDNDWLPVYEIGLDVQEVIDIEVANWFTSANPNSKFRHNLMVARATEDTRFTLLNHRLSIREKGKPAIQVELSPEELMQALAEHFLLPVEKEWSSLLQTINSAQ